MKAWRGKTAHHVWAADGGQREGNLTRHLRPDNGDGTPDLIWQNDSTRQLVVWYMGGIEGNIYSGSNWLSGPALGWKMVGAADFNRDGVPDLVWQNDSTRQVVVWYMGGPQGNIYQSSAWLSGSVPGWTIVGAADFNGDGVPDLVWQNDSTREVVVWYMGGIQGNTFVGSAWLAGSVPGWTIVGAADFNGDGVPDLVWQNDSTREVVVWYMTGAQGNIYLSSAPLSGSVSGWTVIMR